MDRRFRDVGTRPRTFPSPPPISQLKDAGRFSVRTYFQQPCPTCGRRLLILVEHLGRLVFCRQCGRQFTACDPASKGCEAVEASRSLLDRTERLLSWPDTRIG